METLFVGGNLFLFSFFLFIYTLTYQFVYMYVCVAKTFFWVNRQSFLVNARYVWKLWNRRTLVLSQSSIPKPIKIPKSDACLCRQNVIEGNSVVQVKRRERKCYYLFAGLSAHQAELFKYSGEHLGSVWRRFLALSCLSFRSTLISRVPCIVGEKAEEESRGYVIFLHNIKLRLKNENWHGFWCPVESWVTNGG